MVHGVWCMVHSYGVWCISILCIVYSALYIVYGARCMVHGVWCMVYGVCVWCMITCRTIIPSNLFTNLITCIEEPAAPVWCMVYGVSCMVERNMVLWNMVYGVWCMANAVGV